MSTRDVDISFGSGSNFGLGVREIADIVGGALFCASLVGVFGYGGNLAIELLAASVGVVIGYLVSLARQQER